MILGSISSLKAYSLQLISVNYHHHLADSAWAVLESFMIGIAGALGGWFAKEVIVAFILKFKPYFMKMSRKMKREVKLLIAKYKTETPEKWQRIGRYLHAIGFIGGIVMFFTPVGPIWALAFYLAGASGAALTKFGYSREALKDLLERADDPEFQELVFRLKDKIQSSRRP